MTPLMQVTWPDVVVFVSLLVLVEVSLHLRFRPLKSQLDRMELLLAADQAQILERVANHEDRLMEVEEMLSIPARPKPASLRRKPA